MLVTNKNHHRGAVLIGRALVLIFLVYLLSSPPQPLSGVWKKIDLNVRYVSKLQVGPRRLMSRPRHEIIKECPMSGEYP
jgi:hypothetical protein